MNKLGLGVVSLYHELIQEISDEFVTEKNISQRIFNLPVHQDMNELDCEKLIECFFYTLDTFKG